MSPIKRLVLVFIMLWLPLQGALAASMSLCLQEKDIPGAEPDRQAVSNTAMLPCAQVMETTAQSDVHASTDTDQHSVVGHDSAQSFTDEIASSPQCEGTPCQASCGAMVSSASSTTILIGGNSYPVLFNTGFTSLVPEQLQRPPLA